MGFAASGGFGAAALAGLDVGGVLSFDPAVAADAVRFHGAAEPFAAAIPGNTATGFADGSAATDLSPTFGAAAAAAAGGGAGVGRLPAGGGGGGGGGAAAFSLGGTISR